MTSVCDVLVAGLTAVTSVERFVMAVPSAITSVSVTSRTDGAWTSSMGVATTSIPAPADGFEKDRTSTSRITRSSSWSVTQPAARLATSTPASGAVIALRIAAGSPSMGARV